MASTPLSMYRTYSSCSVISTILPSITFMLHLRHSAPQPLVIVPAAVAHAAMESGVARRSIASFSEYSHTLLKRIEYENFFAREHLRHRIGRRGNERERER
jgi:hypothetical protein